MEMREYYQSSKWAEKRNARLKIDGFKCAKCGFTRALEVHHINYERFGDEDVSRDLITLCKKCHQEVEEQKRRINPVIKREHHSVYLAGKISCGGWRNVMFSEYRDHSVGKLTIAEIDPLPINESLTITGPFFISCDHGCYHGDGLHGVGAWEGDLDDLMFRNHGVPTDWPGCGDLGFSKRKVVNLCKKQIDEAEIVFVYIDCRDCFGTLAEIGYAHAKGKSIIIKFKDDDLERDMWFISKMQQKKTDVSDWWIREQLISKIKED
jgi:hypothetical protein